MRDRDRDPDLLIGRKHSDHLAFWVQWRSLPESTDYWDGNWLVTWIELAAGGVRAKAQADLRTEEFERFRRDLERLSRLDIREAVLEPLEPWITVRIGRTNLGSLEVTGELSDELGVGNQVVFALKSDLALADLTSMIHGLHGIEERFPVLGERP